MLEYVDNYGYSSGSLWQFKRDEQNMNNGNIADVTTAGSTSFKYKSNFFENLSATGVLNGVKIAVPLKYLSILFRSLEMPLIDCKIILNYIGKNIV